MLMWKDNMIDKKAHLLIFSFLVFVALPLSHAATSLNSCTTISSPGVYYLTSDITDSSSTCFTISTSNVTLDCQGHVIDGTQASGSYGIYASGSLSNITIRNCKIQEFYYGIYFYNGVHDSKIENVISNDNNDTGILLSSSSYNTLSNITANDNDNYFGIKLDHSLYNILHNIIANNNGYGGITLDYSSNNTLINVTANNNKGTDGGIFLDYSSYNTLINITANNNTVGIYIWDDCENNILANSTFLYNNYGISIGSGGGNNIIYNNIFNGTKDSFIFMDFPPNQWNTSLQLGPNIVGRPFIGGNVYATPSGDGYSQTCDDANHDGICDSPYTLASGNVDYYPLALSKTYPLNPKIYVGEQLAWKYDGFFTKSAKIDITPYILNYINNNCSGTLPCTIPITYKADSRGGINIVGDIIYRGYVVRVENILFENAGIKNITIYSNDYKKVCYTNLSKIYVLPPGGIGIFRIPCDILCNNIKDIIVETTCGVKDKLSSHPARDEILRC